MNGLDAVILGTIQGLVEWLPVSSKAQTMLYMINVLKISPDSALSYAIFLHIGTMFAAIITFRKEYLGILRHPDAGYPLTRFLVLATACTAVTALPLFFLLKVYLLTTGAFVVTLLIGLMLIMTGILLRISGRSGVRLFDQIRDRDTFMVGLAQGIAIIPGISRSGITVATLLGRKIEQETALKLSFLISVPAIIGVILVDLPDLIAIPVQAAILLSVSSFIVGYLSMNLLLKIAGRVSFWAFCLGLGIITLTIAFWTNL
jgi:undecaprenyl-diphosphatase